MSFANLRKQRETRQAPSFAQRDASAKEAEKELISSGPEAPPLMSSAWQAPAGLYQALPSQLEFRLSSHGRGVFNRGTSSSIPPGSTIFSVLPHITALSTRCLNNFCSFCHTEATKVPLKRCKNCKAVWYDSVECQNKDWPQHKLECTSLQQWASANRKTSEEVAGSSDSQETIFVPNEAIRALGRLLRSIEHHGLGSLFAQEINLMQSHRTALSPKSPAHATLTNLAHGLARYLGVTPDTGGFTKWGIDSAQDLVDLLSKFTTNSFTLTSPSLSPIGVCISPLAALINHSCSPNAVIVFPRVPSSERGLLQVIAIKSIKPGEEILTSYIDASQPRKQRQNELKENYMFDCVCVTCSDKGPDPRESLKCPQCLSLVTLPEAPENEHEKEQKPLVCTRCSFDLVKELDECHDAVEIAREGLIAASKLQFSDVSRALKYTRNTVNLLQRFPFHMSFDPALALTRLHQSLLISELSTAPTSSFEEQRTRDLMVDEVCRVGARNVSGVSAIFEHGHPIRGIALAELGKLLCVDVDPAAPASSSNSAAPSTSSTFGQDALVPHGPERLQWAMQVLLRASEELEIGFGKSNGGGDVGLEVRGMLTDLQKEAEVWNKKVGPMYASGSSIEG